MGIEPTLSAWEAEVLPLNYTRVGESLCRIQHAWQTRRMRLDGQNRLATEMYVDMLLPPTSATVTELPLYMSKPHIWLRTP